MIEVQLQKLLTNKGITAHQVSTETNLMSRTLYRILHNPNSLPREKTVKQLCKYFEVKPSDLIKVRDEVSA